MRSILSTFQGLSGIALMLALISPTTSKGHSLWFDNFATNPYADIGEGTRWQLYRSDGSQVHSPGPFGAPYYANWLPSAGINGSGYIFTQQQPGAEAANYLVHVNPSHMNSFSLADLGSQSLSLKWDETRNGMEAVERRVAMQVDGQWFVSERTTLNTSISQRIDFTETGWYALYAEPSQLIHMYHDPADAYRFHEIAPQGVNVTSIGFFTELPASEGVVRTIRYDNVHLNTGLDWAGGSGLWSNTEPNRWIVGGSDPQQTGTWISNEVAAFGAPSVEAPVGNVTVNQNVVVRALEFYENANGAILLGDVGLNTDASPLRTVQINGEYAFRSFYLAPEINVTIGGENDTGLRIYRATNALHLYGGGTLTLERNSMVRSESGGNVILNGGTTVIVKAGAAFNASHDMYLGSGIDTLDGSSGLAHLLLDGGTSVTRTGGAGGDLILGGATGHATLTVKNQGHFTTNAEATAGVRLHGNSTLRLESGGTLSTRQFHVASNFTGSAEIIFDGGVLHMNNVSPASQNVFLQHEAVAMKISTGGAIFNPGGREMIIRNPLLHDPDGSSTDGGLIVRGGGTLTLDQLSTFNGAVRVENSILKIANFDTLGTSSNAAANLVLDGGTLFITGSGIATNRELTLTANGGTYQSAGSSRIHGKIVGAAGSKLTTVGGSWLSGDSRTSFHGEIEVASGEFLVRRAASLGSTTGGIRVRRGATFSIDHNGTSGGGNNMNDNTYADALVLESQATLATRGRTAVNVGTQTIYSGQITLEGNDNANFLVTNVRGGELAEAEHILDLTITGAIIGTGGINKTGLGRMVLTHEANSYTGKTAVQEGILALQGNSSLTSPWIEVAAAAKLDVTLQNTAFELVQQTLSGNGTIAGALVVGPQAELRAGMSQNTLAGDLIGKLSFTSDVTLAENSLSVFQLAGLNDHDQLDFSAHLEVLHGARFQVEWLNFEASLGDSFDLLNWNTVEWDSQFQQNFLANLLLPSFSNASLGWDTSDFLSLGILRVNSVPEPSKLVFTTLGILWIAGIRSRRFSV